MKLLLGGDYFFDYQEDKEDFSRIKGEFHKYDHVVINYEGSLHSSMPVQKAVNLGMSNESLDLPANVVLSLTNNHIFDFGNDGLDATTDLMNKKSLRYFGLESEKGKYDNFIDIEDDEIALRIISFGWKNEECNLSSKKKPGNVNFTRENVDNILSSRVKEKCSTIVYFHAGYEFEYYPLPLHVGLARDIIDKGADLVYASHAHVIQPYEIYKGKMIFYGLGNFYFGSRRKHYPKISDYGVALSISIASNDGIKKVEVKDVIYDRSFDTTTMIDSSDFLTKHRYDFGSVESYSKKYKDIRTRKSNPRPILYYNREISNELKYLIWLFIVRLTGYLKIRQFVKKMLGWS